MSAINNPEVVAESAKQVTNILSTLPSPSAKLNKYLNDLMKSIQSLSTDSSSNDIADFTSKLKKYLNTIDMQQEYMTTNIADLKSASMRYTIDSTKTEGAADNKKTFLTTTITSFQSIITALEAKNMTNPEIIDNATKLQARVTSMQANLTSMKTPATRLEGFASIMNPYDQPSANSRQAHEFALGQRTFIDNVFSGMKI
jgi:phenylalanyl-tRNA synthetase alpha subunit